MKYFVLSDVHNHFTEMKAALGDAGFDVSNPNHKVILVGDAFDRGNEAFRVFAYLKELVEKDKLIWVAGNHEFCLLKRFSEGTFPSHRETYSTMCQIASAFAKRSDLTDEEIIAYTKTAGLEDLIRNNVRPFYETARYVFVHGSLPTANGAYNAEWRKVPLPSWCRPAMKNGMKEVMINDIKVPGKTIVCGHSPAAFGNARAGTDVSRWGEKEFDNRMRLKRDLSNIDLYKPFYGDGVIGIDANVYKTGFINCIVIEEDCEYGK